MLEGIKAVATTLGSQETSDEYDKVTYIYTLPHSQTYLTNTAFPGGQQSLKLEGVLAHKHGLREHEQIQTGTLDQQDKRE